MEQRICKHVQESITGNVTSSLSTQLLIDSNTDQFTYFYNIFSAVVKTLVKKKTNNKQNYITDKEKKFFISFPYHCCHWYKCESEHAGCEQNVLL